MRVFASIERSEQQIDLYSKIDNVSADAFTDERNGQTYFKLFLACQEQLDRLPSDFTVRPGMIAETYILKQDRNVPF